MPADELTHALRREIYDRPYDSIRFVEHRNTIAPSDVYEPTSAALKAVNLVTGLFERVHTRALRERSLARLLDHIEFEDRATQFIRIGPVNAVLNTLVHFFRSPNSDATVRSFAALEGYLWDGHDGTKMNGYNSTALWDTAFAAQAMLDTPVGAAMPSCSTIKFSKICPTTSATTGTPVAAGGRFPIARMAGPSLTAPPKV
jgi:squalene cyclase